MLKGKLKEQILRTDPSQHVEQRARHCWVTKVDSGVYRVVPHPLGYPNHEGKAKRRIQFGLQGNRIFALCSDWHTGNICAANDYAMVCCHVVAAFRRFLRSAEKGIRNGNHGKN